jgi:hypothetical protein
MGSSLFWIPYMCGRRKQSWPIFRYHPVNIAARFLEVFEGPRDILGVVNSKTLPTSLLKIFKFVDYDLLGMTP